MSIQGEIDRIKSKVADGFDAVATKGGVVPEDGKIADMAAAILSIPEGGNSDWAENNEEESSYVRNRTHWKEKGVVKTTTFTNFGLIYNENKVQG